MTRKMQLESFIRTQRIIYKLFGNAWRIPKSVRDNYRDIQAVVEPLECAMVKQEKSK